MFVIIVPAALAGGWKKRVGSQKRRDITPAVAERTKTPIATETMVEVGRMKSQTGKMACWMSL